MPAITQSALRVAPLGFVTLSALLCQSAVYAQSDSTSLSPGYQPNPKEVQGTGGGSVDVSSLVKQSDTPTGPCTGFADRQPNHTLVLGAFFSSLSIQVQSNEDTALAIQGPGGVWCNDDFDGKNPGISGQWLPGTYRIWISSYEKGRSPSYRLRLRERR